MGKQWLILFLGAPKSLQSVTAAMKLKDAYSLEGKLWPTWTVYWKEETFSTKVCLVKAMVFPVVMYGYESWTIKTAELKNWWFWAVVLEKTLESPLDCKEIQPVHPEEDQSWVCIGRTDAATKTPILWPPDAKSWLLWKDPDAGKDWGQEQKGWREWNGWMASPTQWTWIWVNAGSWWWTGRPGMLQSMGSQRVRHDWVTELNWILWKRKIQVCTLSKHRKGMQNFWIAPNN